MKESEQRKEEESRNVFDKGQPSKPDRTLVLAEPLLRKEK